MENGWTERIEELEAENTRLRMYRDAAESRAQGLEAQVAKWKAISPANAMAWQERAENAEAQVAALTAEKDMLRARVGELEADLTEERQRTRLSEAVIRENEALTKENMTLQSSRDEWKLISLEAKAWIEEVLRCMREIGVAE
jgi:hypothetical protein